MIEQAPRPPTIRLAVLLTDVAPRCWHCRQKLADHLTHPWRLRCPKCRAVNASPAD